MRFINFLMLSLLVFCHPQLQLSAGAILEAGEQSVREPLLNSRAPTYGTTSEGVREDPTVPKAEVVDEQMVSPQPQQEDKEAVAAEDVDQLSQPPSRTGSFNSIIEREQKEEREEIKRTSQQQQNSCFRWCCNCFRGTGEPNPSTIAADSDSDVRAITSSASGMTRDVRNNIRDDTSTGNRGRTKSIFVPEGGQWSLYLSRGPESLRNGPIHIPESKGEGVEWESDEV